MNIDEDRLTEDLRELVRIPSSESMDEIAEYALHSLRRAGLESAHLDEDGNVIGVIGEGDSLLLNAHLDTVGVQGFNGDPYEGRIEDGRLIGRGASDCKSGVAALLEIGRHLANHVRDRGVIIALSVWEEASSRETNGAFGIARRVEASDAIVLESTVDAPSRMNVYAGCRGILRADFSVGGTASHSSTPDRGDNALYRATELVERFRERFAPEAMPRAELQLLGRTFTVPSVASLTEIQAMQGRNIIPDLCVVGMDCRLFPGQNETEMKERIHALADELGEKVSVEVTRLIPGHLCRKEDLVRTCQSAARRNGLESDVDIMGGRSDSTIFQNEGNIPTVVFGPGTAGEAHTRDESLDLASFYVGTQACLDAVLALSGESR